MTNKWFLELATGPGVGPFFFFHFSVRFQTGYFCLPTLSKEAQQLPICTPVTQRDGAVTLVNNKATQLQNVLYVNTCLLSRQLKNSLRR